MDAQDQAQAHVRDDLKRAAERYWPLKAEAEQAREALSAAIVAASDAGLLQEDIRQLAGYRDREMVRREVVKARKARLASDA